MRAFAAAWPDRAIVQEPLARIPWFHQIALLEKLSNPKERLWYARMSAAHGWSHTILAVQIATRAHTQHGKALTNFKSLLPPVDSESRQADWSGAVGDETRGAVCRPS